MKYLIIDGNNFAIRESFAHKELTNSDGVFSGVHFGFFRSLINLKQIFPEHQCLVVWDGKSARRKAETKDAKEKGLITVEYKETREYPEPIQLFYQQQTCLKNALNEAGIPQIRLSQFEADDVVATYCKLLKDENEIICVTSDSDYYQLLHENVSLWNVSKQQKTLKDDWVKENQIEPWQYVDCGAFSGDTTDDIQGVPGWGDKTAFKAIRAHGKWEDVLVHLHKIYDPLNEEYPPLKGEEFTTLSKLETPKKKLRYPQINEDMSFTGVALAFEEKRYKPSKEAGFKSNMMALMFEKRVALAYSLKRMDDEIPDMPEIPKLSVNTERILEYFDYFDIESLKEDVGVFK